MNTRYRRTYVTLLVIVVCLAFGQITLAQGGTPPPEAIEACEGLEQGEACSFTGREGNTVTGTCEVVESVLACVPEDGPPPTDTPTPTASPTTISTPAASGYPVVDTGQDTCYGNGPAITCPAEGSSFYGQDAQYTGNAPSYTDNGDGTITDNVTGIMWQQSPDSDGDGDIDTDDKFTQSEAVAYCENLVLAGHDDWQLPDIKQLYSLIDFRGTDPMVEGDDTSGLTPFIDTDYFEFGYGDTDAGERVIDAQFASTTLYVTTMEAGGEKMFGVNLADGRIKGYGLSGPGGGSEKTFYVLCARDLASYGVNDFTDNGDPSTGSGQVGTITDSATGLMWTQDDNGAGVNWEDALAWVEQKNAENYLGYSDWRLPNAKELQSIVDYTRSPDATGSAAIDPVFNATSITNLAGETDYPFYWSGTTHVRFDGSGSNGVYVAFGRGTGSMDGGDTIIDVHGAGSQRSDPKDGDPADYPTAGHGPQGDVQRVFNYVRLVRDADVEPSGLFTLYLPLVLRNYTADVEPAPTPSPSSTSLLLPISL